MSIEVSRIRFGRLLEWILLAIVGLLVLPYAVELVHDQFDSSGQLGALERGFRRYHTWMLSAIEAAPDGTPVAFPNCLGLAERGLLDRARLFVHFKTIADVRSIAPDAVLCEGVRVFRQGRLVLLRDGTIAFVDRKGNRVPLPDRR